MHRGEKVFDGTVNEARAGTTWVRLVTDAFGAAAIDLTEAGLIQGHDQELRIELATGVTAAEVVRFLVQNGRPVHELTPERQTLEGFYLSLVRSKTASAPVQGGSPTTADR
jgi:hypothetical protein